MIYGVGEALDRDAKSCYSLIVLKTIGTWCKSMAVPQRYLAELDKN
jgi:hypothetical protein